MFYNDYSVYMKYHGRIHSRHLKTDSYTVTKSAKGGSILLDADLSNAYWAKMLIILLPSCTDKSHE